MDQFETTAKKRNDVSVWSSIPKIIKTHPRALGWYWDVHAELSYLGDEIGELMFGGEEKALRIDLSIVRLLLLTPSALLLLACRIPFVPLDIYHGVRLLKLRKNWLEEELAD
ncbi:MAG: hypothetical protein M1368_11385 [Thaumarchaeota archaeon]|nr:hypothetical protein [Nitrososphaerota archaeon]